MYKKHRAFGAKPNALLYLLSPPNIKFGIYEKIESKIFIFGEVLT